MISKLSGRFHSWARGWLVIVLLVLDGFFSGYLLPSIQKIMGTPLDLQFISTPAKIFSMIESYGAEMRGFYRTIELTIDIIYPIVYLLFFSLAISWLFQRGFASASKMQRYNTVPLGAWFFDLLENICIVILLTVFPAQPLILAWLLAIVTLVKWLFVGAIVALILTGLVAAARNGFKKQM